MIFKGIVINGVVVMPPGAKLPDGSTVEISPADVAGKDDAFSELISQIAKPQDLPDDFAANHDYYLHGHNHNQQPRPGRWISATQLSTELTEQQTADEASELATLAAQTVGLAPDLATNHNHYLHGLPKR